MQEPDAGQQGQADPWVRAARAPEPLPAPPAGYRFAAPDHLYAPRTDGRPEALPASRTSPLAKGPSVAEAPAMVWSAATSTWEPATRRTPAVGQPLPPALPPPSRRPRRSRRARRPRRRVTPLQAATIGIAILLAALLAIHYLTMLSPNPGASMPPSPAGALSSGP